VDKKKIIQNFAERLPSMSRLPFITDEEMMELYGEEVLAVAAKLDTFGKEAQLCEKCKDRCCSLVKCELYVPEFGRCPVFELRPPICRLHYCHRFFPKNDIDLKDLSDVFFDGLLLSQSRGDKKVDLFDSPPIERGAPDFVHAVIPVIEVVKNKQMSPAEAMVKIKVEAEKFRTNL
jgi:hypothetical protein